MNINYAEHLAGVSDECEIDGSFIAHITVLGEDVECRVSLGRVLQERDRRVLGRLPYRGRGPAHTD